MSVERVKIGEKEIILVGTAHISRKSVELVESTISAEKPDVVGVELDRQRLFQLKAGRKWKETDLGKVIKEGKSYLFLLNLLLANIQRQFGQQVGVSPGEEMLLAVKTAEVQGIPIALLDRDVRVTLKRAIAKMSLWEKLKLGGTILTGFFKEEEKLTAEKIEELKQKDVMSELMNELSREMPSVKEVLVDERDVFIANRILATPGKKIVAVVGAGHIDGIKKHLGKKQDIRGLNTIPKKKPFWKYVKFLVPILFIAFMVWGFYAKGPEAVLGILVFWILINGTLSALGALLARAHPFAIITAFAAAPVTSLHPALAAGWFAGLVEAKLKPPKVKDFESLNKLDSYSDFSRNRATHILLVTAYANIGSTLGTVIALPYILSLLG